MSLEEHVDYFTYKEKRPGDIQKKIQVDFTLASAIRIAKGEGEKGEEAFVYLKGLSQSTPVATPTEIAPSTLAAQSTASPINQPELPLTPSREFGMTKEKPEPQFVPLKSRSQQLLDEAERLRQLAREEAQREANEAQKGSEMHGTVPEILTMLDNRIDGLENRFDLLEKKVNTVLYFFQQASYAVRSLAPVGLPEESVQLRGCRSQERARYLEMVLWAVRSAQGL